MTNTQLFAAIDLELHDLCQPLTNASCHLELGQMVGEPDALRAAVDGALAECRRMFENVKRMRERMAELLAEEKLQEETVRLQEEKEPR